MFVSVLASVAFSVASGLLTALVMMESPVRCLLTDPANQAIRDKYIRRVQNAIHLAASVNVPMVPAVCLILGTACAVIQTWQRAFDVVSLVTAVLGVSVVLFGLTCLGGVVKTALETDSEGDITHIRKSFRRKALFHHGGWFASVLLVLAQLGVALS